MLTVFDQSPDLLEFFQGPCSNNYLTYHSPIFLDSTFLLKNCKQHKHLHNNQVKETKKLCYFTLQELLQLTKTLNY